MKTDLISRSEEQYLINSEELFNRVQKLKHYEVRRNLFDEIGIYEVFKCQDVLDAILASDRIDAVPVVRCKDCDHADLDIPTNKRFVYCNMWGTFSYGNGYCHHSARLVGEEDD